MSLEGYTRKFTAILHADTQAYSRLIGDDEGATLRTLIAYRDTISASTVDEERSVRVDGGIGELEK